MTDRRSLQADAARTSRAFQFIPGHVGGRVASAQPVRRRRTIGGLQAAPPELPTSYIYAGGVAGASIPASVTMTTPSGLQAGDEIIAAFATRSATLTIPTGWTALTSGTYGAMTYGIWHAPYADDLAWDVAMTAGVGGYGYKLWGFRGQAGGSWSLDGPHNLSGPDSGHNVHLVGTGPGFRWQVIFGYSLYANWTVAPPGWPNINTLYEATFTRNETQSATWTGTEPGFIALEQTDGYYIHNSLGSYGTPTTSTWTIRYGD